MPLTVFELERPFQDPVLIVAIAVIAFLVAPLLLQRFRLPGMIGILLAGVIIGPNGLRLLERSNTIALLGTVGIVYLMFVAALEIDVQGLVERPGMSVVFGTISFLLPMAAGTWVGVTFLGLELKAAALFASVFASHTILAFPVVKRLDITDHRAVTTAISGTVLTDTAALLVLALVANSVTGDLDLGFGVRLVLSVVLLIAGLWLLIPRVGRWFFRRVEEESYFDFLFVLSVLFVSAFLAELAGLEAIIGAFLAGLTLNRLIPATSTLMNRIDFVGNALFIPFFLLSVGMLVDPAVFVSGLRPWLVSGAILAVLLSMKLVAAWITGLLYGFNRVEQMETFGLTIGQAAAALAITLIGFDLGLFEESVVNGVVLMIVVVAVISPWLSERYGLLLVEQLRERREAERPPDRILAVFGLDSQDRDLLLDLVMLMRAPGSEEPIHVLTVLEDDQTGVARPDRDQEGDDTERRITAVEEAHEEAEEKGASAEVPIKALTSIEESVGEGVVRAVRENRISLAALGWGNEAEEALPTLLEGTGCLILMVGLGHPLNTAERVLALLPPGIHSHPGLPAGLTRVKRLAKQLGAPFQWVLGEALVERYEELIESADPEVAYEIEPAVGFGGLMDVARWIEEDDLVIALAPRPGGPAWHRSLEQLPGFLAEAPAENVMVLYLEEGDR
ncbi:MAG: cation:proton antiporter [Actinomycetota bacterium]